VKVKDSGITGVLLDTDTELVSDISSISVDEEGLKLFNYTFRVRVDMRGGILFNRLRFSLYSQSPRKSTRSVVRTDVQSSGDVVKAINTETKRRRLAIASDFNKFLIKQREVDIASSISNSVQSRLPLLTDEEAFGYRTKSDLVTPKSVSLDSSLSNVPVLEEIVPEKINSKNNLNIKDNFFKILKNGRDPSEAFLESSFRSRVHTTKERMQGYLNESQDIFFDQTLEVFARSLRRSFETGTGGISKIENESGNEELQIYQKDDSFDQFRSYDLIPVESKELDREKLVDVSFVISESRIPSSRKLFLKAEIVDSNDLIQQTKIFLVDHGKNLSIFETPRENPGIKVKRKKGGIYHIECNTSDQNINSIRVYAKILNENNSINSSFFEIADLSINRSSYASKNCSNQRVGFVPSECVEKKNRANSREYSQKMVSFSYSSSTLSPMLFRAVGVNKYGIPMSNFSSSGCSLSRYVPRHTSIFGRIMRTGIEISISNIPSGVVFVEFLRRNLSRHEREFSPIPILSDIATKENTTIKNSSQEDMVTFFDENVIEDYLYEYGAMLTYSNGDRVLSTGRFIDSFKPPAGISKVNIKNTAVLKVNPKKGSKSVSMDVELVNSDSLFDFVISGMDEYQKSLFSNEISKIKDVLGRSSRIEVVRTNLRTGEARLEMITPGIFIDDGTKFGGVGLDTISLYSYRFEPLIVSPEEIIKDIERSRDIDQNSNMRDPRNRAAAAKKSDNKNRKYSNNKSIQVDSQGTGDNYSQKFYSESALMHGTLDYGSKKSGFDTGRTGDFTYTSIPESFSSPSVRQLNARQISLNGLSDIVLTWRGKNTDAIDHFVIAAEVLGVKMVIGAAHNVSKSGTYTYLSKDFRSFIGGVKFHISPILNNGTTLGTISTDEIVIKEVTIDN